MAAVQEHPGAPAGASSGGLSLALARFAAGAGILKAAEGLAVTAPVPTVPAQQGRRTRGMKQVLTLGHARKSYDGKAVLDDVTLSSARPPC
jgi:hypothetical protein